MISSGDSIPAIPVFLVNKAGATEADTATVLGQGRVVLFTVPGAFTPTCHNNHLPGYVTAATDMKAKGVDRIVCATVNDRHVVEAWANATGALGKIEFIADGNADFIRAIGLDRDMRRSGMGTRAFRAAVMINNGIVEDVFTEDQPGKVTSSGAPAILDVLDRVQSRQDA